MKLSEITCCTGCKGPLLKRPVGNWYVIKVSEAMPNPRVANQIMGLAQMFQGNLGLAEVMGAEAEKAVLVFGDENPELWEMIHVCLDCYLSVPLGQLIEQYRNLKKEKENDNGEVCKGTRTGSEI